MGTGLRVIAGELRGRRFKVPGGVRPTADRVREAVFSAVADRVAGAAVLDLYAGSGAFSIEACSRGAAGAVAVERDRAVAATLSGNLERLGLTDRVAVVRGDAGRLVAADPPPGGPFALVSLDPPYDVAADAVATVLAGLARPGWLTRGATVVIERSARGPAPVVPAGWKVTSTRTYGDTLVVLATAPA